ncbi:MAG: glycosyltransferase family 2 protein [Deltaproteobacteria bacterium]|nr:glycosyltransferase family 2 protein [Deltaproteobacteria bacterium]
MSKKNALTFSAELPLVSVVIPMRNEAQHIDRCIRSLIQQDYPKNLYEILVVDGMSKDHSKKIIQSLSNSYSNIFFLENPNLLTSFGLNAGIRKSKAETIIILGAHSFVVPDFIRRNVEVLKNSGADCVGGPINSLGETYVASTISLAMSSQFGVGDALFRYAESEGYVDTVAFGAYKRTVFKEIGLFDEELVRDQDDELNYRLRKAGGKIFISPQIKSFYYNQANLRKLWIQYLLYGFWKIRVLQKHPKMMQLRQFAPACFVLSIALSSVGSLYFPILFSLLLSILMSYIVTNIFFSFRITRKEGWKYLPLLPVVFSTLHLSYGMGFLAGLIKFISKWFQDEPEPPRLIE